MDKMKSGNTKERIKISKNDLLMYRDSQLSNDDQSKSSNFDVCFKKKYFKNVYAINIIFVIQVLNETSVSKSSSIISENDLSGECGILEEFIDKSIRSSSEYISINNESSIIIPKKFKNKQRVIIDSSDDSDSGQSNLNTRPNKSIHIQSERREFDILESGSSQK